MPFDVREWFPGKLVAVNPVESHDIIKATNGLVKMGFDFREWFEASDFSSARRRLSDVTPEWANFLIFFGLLIILYFMLRGMFYVAYYWQEKANARMMDAMEKREKVKDNFRKDNGYNWDFVMIFEITELYQGELTDLQKEYSHKNIALKLADAGFHTKMFYSSQHDELCLKIRAPLKRLLKQAATLKYRLCCEPTVVANLMRIGNRNGPKDTWWGPIDIYTDNIQTTIPPYEFIYAPFREEFAEEDKLLYKKYNHALLKGADRVKLINQILVGQVVDGGCDLNIYKLLKEGVIKDFFPLHDEVELRSLEQRWFIFWQWPSNTPISPVKDYFGEKIGLFFAYLSHYTTWLFWPSVLGFFSWIEVAYNDGDPNGYTTPAYAAFMAIWATVYLDSWKREETGISMRWGTYNTEEDAIERPEFIDHPKVYKEASPVDGTPILVFPRFESNKRNCLSSTTTAFFVMCVVASVIGVFAAKFILEADDDAMDYASLIFSLLNAVVVFVMSAVYTYIARVLTDYENHRTALEYQDALIGKTFIVEFINSFSAMFFMAFAQPFLAPLGLGVNACPGIETYNSCFKQIQLALEVLFFSKLTTGTAMSLLVPYVNLKLREDEEFAEVDEEGISWVERQYVLEKYEADQGSFFDYADYSIQFAYVTMFVSASPLSCGLALVNNYVSLRLHCWSFCHYRQRPMPVSVDDIGTWYAILEMISYCAVFTSAGIVAFTSTLAVNLTWFNRVWIFVGMSTGVFLLKFLIKVSQLKIADDVKIQLDRNKFILDKLYFNKPDDNDDKLQADVKHLAKAKYAIRINDDDPL